MLLRVAGVVVTAVALLGLAASLMLHPSTIADFLAVLWIGAIPLMLSVVGDRNHGTLDNASGVASVLAAVEMLPDTAPVGVLITDAEELGLAGATAWARQRPPASALNVDSVDDDGKLLVMYTGSPPETLMSALSQAVTATGETHRTLRLIPGILTDSVALERAGWRTVTLSRGTIRTLGRIHTSRDSLATMDGRGIDGAARVLARTVMELV
jgi:Zn-dependent M28 family amino/carboxypeptidase